MERILNKEYFETKKRPRDLVRINVVDIEIYNCGLYYKHVTIVNDDSSAVSKWSFKLIDDPRVIIYDLIGL